MTQEPTPQLYNLTALMERTCLSRSTIYREIALGKIKPIRIGRTLRFSEAEISRYITEAETR